MLPWRKANVSHPDVFCPPGQCDDSNCGHRGSWSCTKNHRTVKTHKNQTDANLALKHNAAPRRSAAARGCERRLWRGDGIAASGVAATPRHHHHPLHATPPLTRALLTRARARPRAARRRGRTLSSPSEPEPGVPGRSLQRPLPRPCHLLRRPRRRCTRLTDSGGVSAFCCISTRQTPFPHVSHPVLPI